MSTSTWPIWAGVALGSGAAATWLSYRALSTRARGVPVIRYHVVGPPRPGSPLNDMRLSASDFEGHLRHLSRRGFQAVTLSEALERRRDQAFLESNPVVLSFDGAFASFWTFCWPLLSRYGLTPVNVFFPAHRLGQSAIHFQRGRPEPLIPLETCKRLTGLGVEIGLLCEDAPPDAEPQALLALWQQERQQLSETIDAPVEHLALPPGGHTRGLPKVAQQAGFSAAVRVAGPGLLTPRAPLHAIGRYAVRPGVDTIHLAFYLASRRLG